MDTIVKALNDLTYALKGRKNMKGDAQIEALERLTSCSTTSQGELQQKKKNKSPLMKPQHPHEKPMSEQ
jgi:hypothetical protein